MFMLLILPPTYSASIETLAYQGVDSTDSHRHQRVLDSPKLMIPPPETAVSIERLGYCGVATTGISLVTACF
jgi:hypothetical protein